MIHLHQDDPATVSGSLYASSTRDRRTASDGERVGVYAMLPEPAVLAAVGEDFDLVDRIRKHVHAPQSPRWSCGACAEPWPCTEAKQELLLDLGWVRLAVYCSVLLERAVRDLPEADPFVLWDRFIAWTHPISGLHDPRLNSVL